MLTVWVRQSCFLRKRCQIRFLLAFAVLAGVGFAEGGLQHAHAEAKVYNFSVPRGTADRSLVEIAQQSGFRILFPYDEVSEIESRELKGEYSIQDAIRRVLQGTELKSSLLEPGVVVVFVGSGSNNVTGEGPMNNSIRDALLGSAAMAMVGLPSAATAQDEDNDDYIVVTGSLIKRSEDSSQLVTNIGEDEIRLRVATNAVAILDAVTANQSSTFSNITAGQSGLTNVAELRSLGPNNTLVLLNGKRIVRNPLTDDGVDLNTVPIAAISSVDVLSDGASSIYGTDAVAGVINFRTKEEFEGIEYNANTLQSEIGAGDLVAGTVSLGIGSLDRDGWNFYAGGTWRERSPLASVETDYANTSVIPERGQNFSLRQSFPANLAQFDAGGNLILDASNPFAPDCLPPVSIPNPGRGCAYDADAAGVIELQNKESQQSVVSKFTGQIGDHQLSLEYFYARSEITVGLAGTTFVFGDFDVPPTSPFYPGNGNVPAVAGLDTSLPITIESRFEPAGRRSTRNNTETDRLLGQLDGVAWGFDYELWALHSTSDASLSAVQGAVFFDAFADGFAGANGAPFLNPFGEQTAEGAAYLESIQFRDAFQTARSGLTSSGLTIGRDLFSLPAGDVAAAAAFEYGRESSSFFVNPIISELDGAVGLREGENRTGSRNRYSLSGEVLIPVVEGLDVNASVRWDRYSDFGSTVNPKVLVSYDLTDNVNIHGAYNTGFRAPTLYDLFSPASLGTILGATNDDPLLCPDGVVNTGAGGVELRDCDRRFNVLFGGNPDVEPEESTAFNAGVTFRFNNGEIPFGKASFSIDYWNYKLTNTIGTINANDAFADPTTFSEFFVRCSEAVSEFLPQTQTCPIPGGGDALAYVLAANANVGESRTTGLDFTFDWGGETPIGIASLTYRSTWVHNFDFQQLPGGEFQDRAGAFISGRPVVPYSHFAALTVSNGPISVQLQNRYLSGYEDCNAQCGIDEEFFNRVEAYSLFNLAATYSFSEQLVVTAHINNLLDTDPSFSNGGFFCATCDLRFADPTGRTFGVTLSGSLASPFRR